MAHKILAVDDDPGFLAATQAILQGAGYEVETASCAAEARDRLASQTPDLILLDVLMPEEDGFTFADALDGDSAGGSIPVVLVTAVAESPGQMMQAFGQDKGLTAVDILPKSAAHTELLPTVRRALEESCCGAKCCGAKDPAGG